MKAIGLASLLWFACLANAQDYPKAEIFGGYSYLNVDTEGLTDRFSAHGWEASVVGNVNKWLGVEANFSGHYRRDIEGTPLNADQHSFLFGPRFAYRQKEARFTPFAHALFGFDRASLGAFGFSVSEKSFAMAFGGGLDYKVNRTFSIRVGKFDYLYTRHAQDLGGTSQNNYRASAGIVITLGARKAAGASPSSPQVTAGVEIPSLGAKGVTANRGVELVSVPSGSPAAVAGMQARDLVVAVDDKPVATPEELQSALAARTPGSAKVTYLIRGAWKTEKVVELR